MKILVDADACPVKEIIIEEAKKYDLTVLLVKSFAHFSTNLEAPHVETIYVDSDSEAADYKIMQLAKKGDVVITQDYGLASLLLAKDCIVLHHKGFIYSNRNIDTLLNNRYISSMVRKSGGKTKGPKALTDEDRRQFRGKFVYIIEKQIEQLP
ncbi:YaiI/YqxD family protein [Bacillaceae bacterium W0354]